MTLSGYMDLALSIKKILFENYRFDTELSETKANTLNVGRQEPKIFIGDLV